MHGNPNNIAAFGPNPDRRYKLLNVFFRRLLPAQSKRGLFLGAFDGSRLLGVCGMAAPGQCQPALYEKVQIAGGLLIKAAPAVLFRLSHWGAAWAHHDPGQRHWHLGPVAVDRDLQGHGVGSALLTAFCQRMDEAEAFAYLETDKHQNTIFYQKHGFVVQDEGTVLGLPNWYMSRTAQAN
jgi:ribosomal protein S18 acetylase RimI-like enzyme